MKNLITCLLATLALLRASAQVSVELDFEQEQFLPSESIRMAVKITNRSGQQLHLGTDADWLTFNVESSDGFVVIKNSDVPVIGEFDLESSQMAIKRVDLQPCFSLPKPGRYRVTATLRIKQWSKQVSSAPQMFDVISGSQLWTQDFGVTEGTNSVPEVRKYTLTQANYLRDQLRLYVQVSDVNTGRVLKVNVLGPMVSFSHPEAQVDRSSHLHVLWQTGAQVFAYCIVKPDGSLAKQEMYDNYNSRPRLAVNEEGEVSVRGGTRRMNTSEYPAVKAPNELPPMTSPNPAK
jgi:hypothetical protein